MFVLVLVLVLVFVAVVVGPGRSKRSRSGRRCMCLVCRYITVIQLNIDEIMAVVECHGCRNDAEIH